MEVGEVTKMFPVHLLLTKKIRGRLKALKKLQLQILEIHARFFQDVHRLDIKFGPVFGEVFNKRLAVVSGKTEPTEEDTDLTEDYESPEGELADSDPNLEEARRSSQNTKELDIGQEGIPGFWLTVLKNGRLTQDLVYPEDEPLLRHLMDIRCTAKDEPPSFTLHFHFRSNPYFTNRVLTKEYELRTSLDPQDPWSFSGPEILRSKGCKIDWNKGMDVTEKTLKKRQRHKTRNGQVRTVIKTMKTFSFFNFFTMQDLSVSDAASLDSTILVPLVLDFQIGRFMKERLVPRAVLYFTGEALDSDLTEDSDSLSSRVSDDSFPPSPKSDEEKTSTKGPQKAKK